MATQASLARVQELYVAYYGRPADQAGLEYWAGRVDEEGEAAIINAFGNSEEYEAKAEGEGNATLVNNVYLQAFGRDADPEGLTYYTGVLESGEKSLAEIATTIINAAGGIDKQTFDARVEAAGEYTTEFGAAEDYDLETAQSVVVDTDGGVYLPELTAAIDELQSAEQAKADFLAEADGDDDPETSASAGSLDTAVTDAETALSAFDSENQLQADLQDAQDAVAEAEAAIAEVPGLRKEIADYEAAQEEAEAAADVEADASATLSGRVATFNELNSKALVADDIKAADGVVEGIIELNADDELVIADDVDSNLEGVDALLSDIQSWVSADEALTEADEAEAEALADVQAIDGGEALYSQLSDAKGSVEAAETALEDRAEAQQELDDAQALVDELDALDEDIEDAQEAIADEDVDLNDAEGDDVETDLFVFDAEAGTTTDSKTAVALDGDDLFFIGDAFSRVDLEDGDDLTTEAFGDAGELEVFFQQNDASVDAFFEGEAFQGSDANSFDGATIELTGVNVEDLQLENGYISIA